MKKEQFIFPKNRKGKLNIKALEDAYNRKMLTRTHIANILGLKVATMGPHIKQGLLPPPDDILFDDTKLWFRDTIFKWLRTNKLI